jgi:hypothetical protein
VLRGSAWLGSSGSLDYAVSLDGSPLSSWRCREELGPSASLPSGDNNAPSKPGTTHLGGTTRHRPTRPLGGDCKDLDAGIWPEGSAYLVAGAAHLEQNIP